MIIQEIVTINGKNYMRTISSEGRYVSRDGVHFTEAIDPESSNRIYVETDLIPFEVVGADYINAFDVSIT